MPRTEEQFKQMREKTQSLIIETALELFAQNGYKGTSIAQIAKEAGISKGLAYNYFESKEKLAEATFSSLNEKIAEVFGVLSNIEEPAEQLKIMIEQTFSLVENREEYWRLYMSFILQPDVKGIAELVMGKFLDDTLGFVKELLIKLNIPNPEVETRIFGAILDGVCFHYLLDTKNYPIKEIKKYLIDRYCKAIV